MMKKLLIGLVAVLLMFSATACSSTKGADKSDGSNGSVNSETEEPSVVTLKEQVIYDANDFKVTVTGMDSEGIFGPAINVRIENNSAQAITVQTEYCTVNDLMHTVIFSAEVAAGKKANDTITLSETELEKAGIVTIKDIEFILDFMNPDSYETIVMSDVIKLTTDADPSFVQKYNEEGNVIYDENGIKVVTQGLDKESNLMGPELCVYMENKTEQNITVQVDEVSVNGYMMDPLFSSDIISGKKALDGITFLKSKLEENQITDITEIELVLNIFDSDNWETIQKTETIKITL